MATLLLIAYFGVLALLAFSGLHRLHLIVHALRPARPERKPEDAWPTVLVQLPMYNEAFVAERVIRAAARLEYPVERLRIQVLDDSTDETVALVNRVVADLQGGRATGGSRSAR